MKMFEMLTANDYEGVAKLICNGICGGDEDGVWAKTISIGKKKVVIEGIRFRSPLPADVSDIGAPSEKLLELIKDLVENKKSFSTVDGNGDGGLIQWRYNQLSEERARNRNPYQRPFDETPALKPKASVMQKRQKDAISKLLAEVELLGYKKVRADEIRRFKKQPREFFDESKLEQLAGSIKYGQRQDVILMKLKKPDGKIKYELIDGERRWRSVIKAGTLYLEAKIYASMSEKQQFLFSAVSNFGREGHTEWEETNTLARAKRDYGLKDAELAIIFSKSPSWVSQRLALLKLDPRVLEMMKANDGKKCLDSSRAYLLSTIVDHDRQFSFAKEILEKNLSLNQAKHLVRNRALKEGFELGARKRKPKDDYRNLSGFLRRTFDDVGVYVEMPENLYLRIFKFRNMSERDEMTKIIDKIFQLMLVLKDRMLMLD